MTRVSPAKRKAGQKGSYHYTVRYALLGAAFGLLFPIVATFIVLSGRELSFSLANIVAVQLSEPLLWIIDTAPIFLGLFAALVGRREDRLRLAARELQMVVDSLEERVKERTRDLDRAVDVGHKVSRVRELDPMLAEAVELVRANFDLYYVQAYLVDASGRNLELRAGSGALGRTLVRQSKRLPIGMGTIVGTAAAEKQTVVVANTSTSPIYRPNPLLPDTWSEMAVPLMIADRLVGVLDLQSDTPGALTAESLPALEAVAGQLAVAIEHARSVAEATRARAEIEAQARRAARASWADFLDAIGRSERIGVSYDLKKLTPLTEPLSLMEGKNTLAMPIRVTGEEVGAIQVQGKHGHTWSREDRELVAAVADQVARQVESLRLLAEAERYREDAEQATRRLIGEGWEEHFAQQGQPGLGYVYDQTEVYPISLAESEVEIAAAPASVTLPLAVRGQMIGRLELVQPEEPSEEVAELMTSVADQLSSHLENLRLTQQTALALAETGKQASRLAALNDLSQALAAASTLDEVFRVASEKTRQVVPADRTSIAILSEDGDSFEMLTLKGHHGASRVGEIVPLEGSAIGVAIKENRVVHVRQSFEGEVPGHESFMVAPLKTAGRTIGTLNVGRSNSGPYDRQDEQLLLQVSSLLASAVDSRQLFTETEKRAKELALINQVAQAISQQLELDQLLETVYQQIDRALHPDAFYIGLYNPDTEVMDYAITYESGKRGEQRGVPLYPQSHSYRVIHDGEPMLRNLSTEEVEAYRSERPPTLIGDRMGLVPASLVYVPLRSAQRVQGVMSVQSFRFNAYKESDLTLLTGIANYVAVALENAQLFRQAEMRADELAVLNEMGRELTSLVNVDSVIESIHQHTGRLMNTSSFYVALYNPELDEVDIRFFGDDESLEKSDRKRRAGHGLTEYVIRTRQPLLIKENVRGRAAELGIELFGRVPDSWLGVPLMTGNQVIGVIAVRDFTQPQAYDRRDQDLLTAVASQAAIAIENARLFEQVQARARRERILREITARVRGTADIDTVMRTAAKELGRALGRQTFVYIDQDDQEQSEPSAKDRQDG